MIRVDEIGPSLWRALSNRWVLGAFGAYVAIMLAAAAQDYDISLHPLGISYNPMTTRMVPLKAASVGGDGLFVDGKQLAKRAPTGEWIAIDRSTKIEGGHIFYRAPR